MLHVPAQCELLRGRVGRLVRLKLARSLVSAFGEIPILEFTAASRPEHQETEIAGGRRNPQNQFGKRIFLARILVIQHQVASGRNPLAHQPYDFRLQPQPARVDRSSMAEFDSRGESAFDPRLHFPPAAAYDTRCDRRAGDCAGLVPKRYPDVEPSHPRANWARLSNHQRKAINPAGTDSVDY